MNLGILFTMRERETDRISQGGCMILVTIVAFFTEYWKMPALTIHLP